MPTLAQRFRQARDGWRGLPELPRVRHAPVESLEKSLNDAASNIVTAVPSAPIPQPDENRNVKKKPDTMLYGAPGTPIVSGFVTDYQEYNNEWRGRAAFHHCERMRRSDADVAATLRACKLPIEIAEKKIIPGVPDNHPNYKQAQEIAKLVEENLFGGLEYESESGGKISQSFDDVIDSDLMCLDFGCSATEDMYVVDQDRVRVTRLASRLPMTFYQFPVDRDGETLRELIQWGYRGDQWVTAAIPANKVSLFSFRKEGANFYGQSLCREMYQSWFIKTALYKIDAIACERAGVGVPTFIQGKNPSTEDLAMAASWAENMSANENTSLSLPDGWQFKNEGVTGALRQIMPSIQHHSEMICRAPLAMFMALGTTATGSRSLGNTMVDFFQLMEEWIARFICNTISETTIRRIVDFNYDQPKDGTKLPYPRLTIPHIAVINPLELANSIKDLAAATTDILQPDDGLENWYRKRIGAPPKSGQVRPRYAPVSIRDMSTPAPTDTPLDIEENKPGDADNEPETPTGKLPGSKSRLPQSPSPQQPAIKPQAPKLSPLAKGIQPKAATPAVSLSEKLQGRIKWHGLDISIENAAGSTRTGVDKNGKAWARTFHFPYGYLRVKR